MAFLGSLSFTRQLMMTAAGLWLAGIIAAAIWFGLPYLPGQARAPIDQMITPEIWAKAELPLKIAGGILIGLPPLYTGGLIYFLAGTRRWQAKNNEELGKVGLVQWVSLPGSDKIKWKTSADMWNRLRTPLSRPDFEVLMGRGVHISLEVIAIEGDGIYWLMWVPDVRQLPGKRQTAQDLPATLGNALSGYNPRIRVTKMADPLARQLEGGKMQLQWIELGLSAPSHYPIKTDFEVDPMMSLVSSILTDGNAPVAGYQVLVRPVGNWQAPGRGELNKMIQAQAETNARLIGQAEKERRLAMEAKLDQFGFETLLRFFALGNDPQSLTYRLRSIQDTLGQYQGLNAFTVAGRGNSAATLLNRAFPPRLDPVNILNIGELATLYHLPNSDWEPVTGIKWSPARVIAPAASVIRDWITN